MTFFTGLVLGLVIASLTKKIVKKEGGVEAELWFSGAATLIIGLITGMIQQRTDLSQEVLLLVGTATVLCLSATALNIVKFDKNYDRSDVHH